MSTAHCTFGYHSYSTSELDTFSNQVGNGIYTNTTIFVTPTVTHLVLTAHQQAFSTAAAEYVAYGAIKKTAFVGARKVLIDTLDLLADYVNSVAHGDESVILLSGYVPSATAAQKNIPVEKINAFIAKRTDNTGEIMVEIPTINNRGVVNYFCICVEGAPLTNPTLMDGQLKLQATETLVRYDFTKSRKKYFKALTPGITYFFYVFASNTVSVAPLSDSRSVMAA